MKTKRRQIKSNSTKTKKQCPKLPLEVWRLVLSLLPFKAQLKCRLICKDWLDLISTLPEFKDANCLNLDGCELAGYEEPVTTILNSKLIFGTLKIGNKLTVKIFPTLPSFLARIAETVTHLDISQIKFSQDQNISIYRTDACRMVVENLCVFKVLQKFTINGLGDWIGAATSTSPEKDVLTKMLAWVLSSCRLHIITHDLVKSILESHNMDFFRQSFFLQRHTNLILEKIVKNLEDINDGRYFDQRAENEVVEDIVEKIVLAIAEADKTMDLSTRINTSVRILAFEIGLINDEMIEKMFQLVPNVKEFHIINISHYTSYDEELRILKKLSENITSVHVESQESIEIYNLRNLHHLRIGTHNIDFEYHKESVERCLDLSPNIKSISVYTSSLPQIYVDYITELHIFPSISDQLQLKLSNLVVLRNLHSLEITLGYNYSDIRQCCFSGHQPVKLETVKKLEFNSYHDYLFCLRCFEALMQSLPNLRELDFFSEISGDYEDHIFMNQPNLEKLELRNQFGQLRCHFAPSYQWPVMKRLKYLVVLYTGIRGNVLSWTEFGKKLPKLRYFEVNANECDDVDLFEIIRTSPSSFIPSLQKVSLLVAEDSDTGFKPIVSKTIEVNGRNVAFEKYFNDH